MSTMLVAQGLSLNNNVPAYYTVYAGTITRTLPLTVLICLIIKHFAPFYFVLQYNVINSVLS